jgi:hypothetical protein
VGIKLDAQGHATQVLPADLAPVFVARDSGRATQCDGMFLRCAPS